MVRGKAGETVAIVYRFRNEFTVADPQCFLHAVAQSFAGEGFWQKVIGPGFESMSARDFSAHSRDEDDRDPRGRRVAPEDLTNRKAIDVWQPHVQKNQIGRITTDERKTVRSGFGGENFEACLLQVVLNEFDEIRLVVNHQDFGRHVRALAQEECPEQRRESESEVTKSRRRGKGVNEELAGFRAKSNVQSGRNEIEA